MIEFPAENPDHECSEFGTIASVAKQIGVPYQYVYGLAKRSVNTNNKITVRRIGNEWHVCIPCVKGVYGMPISSELRIDPIQAYRTFDIINSKLVSWYRGTFVWEPDGVQAVCAGKCKQVPGKRHGCGLYAVGDPNDPRLNGYGSVLGAVELWGHYIEGDTGWRAEYGKPIALLCDSWKRADEIHSVAKSYGIPVVHNRDALKSIAEEVNSGYWEASEGGGSDAETGEGTAPCREAARACTTVQEIRYLIAEGVISTANVGELLQ